MKKTTYSFLYILALIAIALAVGEEYLQKAQTRVEYVVQPVKLKMAPEPTKPVLPDRFVILAEVESGWNDYKVGASGEVSRYQMLPSVWWSATDLPLSAATNPLTALNVAKIVMAKRIAHFISAMHRDPDNREFYILWNAPFYAERLRVPKVVVERSIYFDNLCQAK